MQHHVRAGGVAMAGGGGAYWGVARAMNEEVGSSDAVRQWLHGGSLLE